MSLHANILEALKAKPGEWFSGEMLAESLHVSRTAIWKQIKKLQSEGYEIDSLPKKGYRLNASPDLLLPNEVCPDLKTKVFGRKNYFYYPEIDSTNNRARDLAIAGYSEGTVVVAERQTAGRGRRGRSWYSPASQGIYVSVILRPVLSLPEIAQISLVAAVAVAETLAEDLNLPARIKWPNDILVNGKKICGILTEAVTDMDSVEYMVLGMGLNINHRRQDFPAELRTIATSTLAEYGCRSSRVSILQDLLLHFERHYYDLLQDGLSQLLGKIRNLSMVIGQTVRIDTLNGFYIGEVIDIDDAGFLKVRDQHGFNRTVVSGEITVLSPCE